MSTKIETAAKEVAEAIAEAEYENNSVKIHLWHDLVAEILAKHFPPAEPAVSVIRTDPLRGEVYGPAVSGEELERKLLAWMRAEAPVTIVQIASEARKIMEGRS